MLSRVATDSEPNTVVWTRIPIVGLPELRCDVRVTEDGRAIGVNGDPLPFDVRPFECGKDGYWLLGRQPLCQEHAREVARLLGDDINAIDAEWRSRL